VSVEEYILVQAREKFSYTYLNVTVIHLRHRNLITAFKDKWTLQL